VEFLRLQEGRDRRREQRSTGPEDCVTAGEDLLVAYMVEQNVGGEELGCIRERQGLLQEI